MKKTAYLWGIVFLLVLLAFVAAYFGMTQPKNCGEFSVETYSEEIATSSFQSDQIYEAVLDYQGAARIGKQAIADRFEAYKSSIFSWMACDVRYDPSADMWFVRVYRVSPWGSGTGYNVILRSDGSIRSIWGEKW